MQTAVVVHQSWWQAFHHRVSDLSRVGVWCCHCYACEKLRTMELKHND